MQNFTLKDFTLKEFVLKLKAWGATIIQIIGFLKHSFEKLLIPLDLIG